MFELAGAVLFTDGPVTTLVELCLAGVHRPGRGSLDDGLNAGREVDVVHMVGGGSQNELLCQLTADACALPDVAGSVEATALGNLLVQARTHQAVAGDLWSLRALVRATQTTRRYEPQQTRDGRARLGSSP